MYINSKISLTSSPTVMKKNSYNFKNFRKAGITNIQTKPRSNQGGFISLMEY